MRRRRRTCRRPSRCAAASAARWSAGSPPTPAAGWSSELGRLGCRDGVVREDVPVLLILLEVRCVAERLLAVWRAPPGCAASLDGPRVGELVEVLGRLRRARLAEVGARDGQRRALGVQRPAVPNAMAPVVPDSAEREGDGGDLALALRGLRGLHDGLLHAFGRDVSLHCELIRGLGGRGAVLVRLLVVGREHLPASTEDLGDVGHRGFLEFLDDGGAVVSGEEHVGRERALGGVRVLDLLGFGLRHLGLRHRGLLHLGLLHLGLRHRGLRHLGLRHRGLRHLGRENGRAAGLEALDEGHEVLGVELVAFGDGVGQLVAVGRGCGGDHGERHGVAVAVAVAVAVGVLDVG